MTDQRTPSHPDFCHEVLIHHDDASLVSATRRFVARGLDAGADVLVHSNRSQVALLKNAIGSDPRLSYGFDEEMYASPTPTLFEYQRQLAARQPGAPGLWVTGTVPLGATSAARSAWARYESSVNEALDTFPLHALCTYDARTTPPAVLATARATHPDLNTGYDSVPCPQYRAPAAFLADPLAGLPEIPRQAPTFTARVRALDDVTSVRGLIRRTVRSATALPLEAVESLTLAVHEVATNAVVHGAPPVSVHVWAELAEIVVQVRDAGPGGLDPLTGYRFPEAHGPLGLWVARHEVDALVIDTPPSGGCRVLLFKS